MTETAESQRPDRGSGRPAESFGEWARPVHRKRIVLGLMLTMALASVDATIVSTAAPQIVADLGGFTALGWVFSGYLLALTVTIPVYGKLADLYGRKPVLVAGTLIFLLGSGLCAAAWNMSSLIVFRAVQGLGAGSIQATVQTLAADLYPVERRGRISAALATVWGVSAVLGPAFGGLFAQYDLWRWIFLINLPIGAVALVLIVRYLHERLGRGRPGIDWAGAGLVLCTGVALILALLQGGVAWPWLSWPSLGLLGGAAVLMGTVVIVERRAREPVLPLWLWTRRVLAGVSLSHLCIGVIIIGPTVFLPVYAQVVLGLGPVPAGLVMTTMSMSWPLAAALCSRLYLRIGFRDTALIGAVTATAAALWMLLLPYRPPVWHVVGATLLLGAGMGLLSPPTLIGAQSTVEREQRGTVTASVVFCRYLGQSLGAAVLGAVSNAALAARLADAPAAVRERLPGRVDDLGNALPGPGAQAADFGPAAVEYLRHALSDATQAVYAGVGTAGAVAVLLLVFITPRRFPLAGGDSGKEL